MRKNKEFGDCLAVYLKKKELLKKETEVVGGTLTVYQSEINS